MPLGRWRALRAGAAMGPELARLAPYRSGSTYPDRQPPCCGLFRRCGFFTELRDELIERPCARLSLVTQSDGNLAACNASIGLAFTETPDVGNGRACECHGFRSVNLCIR